jgi:hypothetical protein
MGAIQRPDNYPLSTINCYAKKAPWAKNCHLSTVNRQLSNHLEFAGLYEFAVFVEQVVKIESPVKIGEIDGDALGKAFLLVYLLADKAGELKGIALVVPTLQLEGNHRSGGIGVKFYQF